MMAHVSVVSLVAVAAAAGITQAQAGPHDEARAESGFPLIVSTVRGAAVESTPTSTAYSLGALPADDIGQLDRGARPLVPPPAEPMRTPVAVDPNATPLAAPNGVGGTTLSGPTSRGSVPPPATGGLVWPVPGGSYSQYFHAGHLAVDIAAPYGSQIVAAQSGVVTFAGWRSNGGGYVVTIDHGNGMQTAYNHLSSIWVSGGQSVAAGQGIGGIGCTGICTGPHVHFEVIVNGIIDNPQRYF